MKAKNIVFIFCVLFTLKASAQSVAYSREYEFVEGAFLTIEDFKNNDPITKTSIVSALPKGQVDFMTSVMQSKYLVYKDQQGLEQKVETDNVWGYCQNRSVFYNFNREYTKLNVIGSLSHFIGKKYTQVGYTDPMNYNYGINTSDDQHQFVLDTFSDKVYDFNVRNMEKLLEPDAELFAEFQKIPKRKKQDQIFIYLRKYNEKHPLMLRAN